MDEIVNRYARELADAIAAAVAQDPRVEACRQKARAAGYEMRVTLEAVVSFQNRSHVGPPLRVATAPRLVPAPSPVPVQRRPLEITASDRRFLRSLRIAADQMPEEVE